MNPLDVKLTIKADPIWIKKQRNKSIIIISFGGIIIVILSLILQSLTYALIRGLIFLTALIIVYYKPQLFYNYYIQFFRAGKIIVRKGFFKSEAFVVSGEKIPLEKRGRNWLIGANKVRVPIDIFPDLEKKIEVIS